MELKGKQVALLIEDLFNEFEVIYPYYRLLEAGADVRVIGSGQADVFKGKYGVPFPADLSADQIDPAHLAGVVIPGGYAPDRMRRHPEMVDLVRAVHEGGKTVAAICHGGWMLSSADIVRGRKLTSYVAIRDDLVHAGAEWLDREVVVDGRLITSRQPADMPAFMREVLRSLAS